MMRYLIISVFILLISSCSLPTTKNLIEKEISKNEIENLYFSDLNKDYVYKAKIDVYGNKLGGILIIKKIVNDNHRVVFTTEFGNKLFDFLFMKDQVINNFIIEELDKKLIINTLQKDFRLLVSDQIKIINQYDSKNSDVYKTVEGNRNNFYFINKNSYTLDKIVSTSKSKEKVEILYSNIENKIANSILIIHKNNKLTIALEKFKKD